MPIIRRCVIIYFIKCAPCFVVSTFCAGGRGSCTEILKSNEALTAAVDHGCLTAYALKKKKKKFHHI